MGLSREFIFALDDSGGNEPLINKNGQISESQFPFFSIAAAGINKSLVGSFRDEWDSLREKARREIGASKIPAFHARLMFGKSRPLSYRGSENPWLHVPHEKSAEWYLEALKIFGRYSKTVQGGMAYSTTHFRKEIAQQWYDASITDLALKEAEFLKIYDRKKYPKLYRKYISHASAVLVEPTLDCIIMIQESVRQAGSSAELLLDPYSDSSGFNDKAAFGFISKHLEIKDISAVSIVNDTDGEPLCQAADLIAYAFFRRELHAYRTRENQNPAVEPMIAMSQEAMLGRSICSKDVIKWINRYKLRNDIHRIYVASRYATAHFELSSYAPDFVADCLKTPDEFLEAAFLAPPDGLYLPIVRDDIFEAWLASRTP